MEHPGAADRAGRPRATGLTLRAGDHAWLGHPVDVRFSLPLPFGRYYLTLVAGPDRRKPGRESGRRPRHPWATAGSILFFFLSAIAINAAAAVGLLIYSAVLRF